MGTWESAYPLENLRTKEIKTRGENLEFFNIALLAKEMIDIANKRDDLKMTVDLDPFTGYAKYTIDNGKRKIFEFNPRSYVIMIFSLSDNIHHFCCNDEELKFYRIKNRIDMYDELPSEFVKKLKDFIRWYQEWRCSIVSIEGVALHVLEF